MKFAIFVLSVFFCMGSSLLHADATNNGAWFVVDERAADAGSNADTALPLSLTPLANGGTIRILGEIGTNQIDFFRFELPSRAHVRFDMLAIAENSGLSVQLIRGELSRESYMGFHSSELRGRWLEPGTYFLSVENQESGVPTAYNIFLTAEFDLIMPEDTAGNDIESALFLRTFRHAGENIEHNGWVDPDADQTDFFRIDVNTDEPHEIEILLDGLQADVDLSLQRIGEGVRPEHVDSSSLGGKDSEVIRRVLAPGVYYIHVYVYEASSSYRLQVTLGPPGVLPVTPPTTEEGEVPDHPRRFD